jgi:hypothetical protein
MKVKKMNGILSLNSLCILLFLFLSALWISTQIGHGLFFGHDVGLPSQTKSIFLSPAQITATEKGKIYIVWSDNKTVYFASSLGNQTRLDPAIILSDINKLVYPPQLYATEKGDVYVVWVDKNGTSGDSDIIFRGSSDSGNNFNSRINLNRGGHILSYSISPQIAATEKGEIYVVWSDHFTQFREISQRGGIVGEIVSIGNNSATSINPQITATGHGDIFLTWIEIKNTTSYPVMTYEKISKEFFNRSKE